MQWTNRTRRMMAAVLSVSMLWLGLIASGAQAAVVPTTEVLEVEQLAYDKSELRALMTEQAVVEKMQALGVSPADVDARIDALTAEELAQLNEHIADMPAGSGVLGLIVLIFLVFIITDIIGATDIFPFVHPVR